MTRRRRKGEKGPPELAWAPREGWWLTGVERDKVGSWTLREPCAGNHTVTHSIKLINGILYIMRVDFPCGPLSCWGGKAA